MIEIVFLGTGSGIPVPDRNHTAIWLRYEAENFLWDCGEGTQRQMQKARINFMKIDRIYVSHWHADHWAGIIGYMQTLSLEGRKKPLYIYAPEAERFVGDILDLDYWGPGFKVIPKDVPYRGSDQTVVFEHKDFEISSIPVRHSIPSVAYCFRERDHWNVDIKKAEKLYGLRQGPMIGKLKGKGEITFKGKKIRLKDVGVLRKGVKVVYSGDTKPCRNMVDLAEGADVLIHDATFTKERPDRNHAGALEAAEIAKQAGVKKLVLTHFSRRYRDTSELLQEARSVFKDSVAARDFMKMKV